MRAILLAALLTVAPAALLATPVGAQDARPGPQQHAPQQQAPQQQAPQTVQEQEGAAAAAESLRSGQPNTGVSRDGEPQRPGDLQNWDTSERRSPAGQPGQAAQEGLTSPDVVDSLGPEPTPQGTRPPDEDVDGGVPAQAADAQELSPLYVALHHVRRAPPGLDGTPVARPNDVAAEPQKDASRRFPPPAAEQQGDAAPMEGAPAEEQGGETVPPAAQQRGQGG